MLDDLVDLLISSGGLLNPVSFAKGFNRLGCAAWSLATIILAIVVLGRVTPVGTLVVCALVGLAWLAAWGLDAFE
jgi:hypothetical protein